MGKTLILGVGNLLLTDEGVGIHAVRKLEQIPDLPENVEVVDGGTAGLNLLGFLEDVDRLVIVDAVETRCAPGTIIRLAGEQVPAYMALKVSPHEITLPDFLAAAQLSGICPKEVVVWGIQPDNFDVGVELSPVLAGQLDTLVGHVVDEVYRRN